MKSIVAQQFGKILAVSVMVSLVGCIKETNDQGVNVSSSYEVLSSYVESWQIIQPTEKLADKPDTEKSMFRMRFIREEGIKASEECKKAQNQNRFDSCVKSAYESFPIHAINLKNYMETEGYKAFKNHPELRKLLDNSKKDGKISNGEFQKIIIKTQELLTMDYEKQYYENIANL